MSVSKDPYTYIPLRDGAPVGKYNPLFSYITPNSKHLTREKFLDMRDPSNRTDGLIPPVKYPVCTFNGSNYCSVQIRKDIRGT